MTENKKINKIWNVTSTVIVVIFVLIAVGLMGLRILGLTPYSVLSGSMEPEYSVGDLIYVKRVPIEELKVGDDVTFMINKEKQLATHRIIAIDKERGYVYTQGIANDTPDTPVHYNNVVGKVVYSLPVLGYVSNWVLGTPGKYITISLGVVFVVALFLPDIIRKKKATENAGEDTSEQTEENESAE